MVWLWWSGQRERITSGWEVETGPLLPEPGQCMGGGAWPVHGLERFPGPRQSLWFCRPKAGVQPSSSSLREQGLQDVIAVMRGNGSQLGVTIPLTARMGADKLVCIMLGGVQRLSYQPWSGGTRGPDGGA